MESVNIKLHVTRSTMFALVLCTSMITKASVNRTRYKAGVRRERGIWSEILLSAADKSLAALVDKPSNSEPTENSSDADVGTKTKPVGVPYFDASGRDPYNVRRHS